MTPVQTLIDNAADKVSRREIAQFLQVSVQRLSDWYVGRRDMPPIQFVRLAEFADEPERTELLWLYIKDRAEKISTRFKALLRRGMAATSKGYVLA